MYEWQRNQLRAGGFCKEWEFMRLCITEKMRMRGIKSIPLAGYYSEQTMKRDRMKYDEGGTS